MQVTRSVDGGRLPDITQDFSWDTNGIGELVELVELMVNYGVRYRESGLEKGVIVFFEHGDIDHWYVSRITGTRDEMTHLIRLMNMFIQVMNDSPTTRSLGSEQVFRAICAWIARRHSGVVDGPFSLHDNLHYDWQMVRMPLQLVLQGEVPFPE